MAKGFVCVVGLRADGHYAFVAQGALAPMGSVGTVHIADGTAVLVIDRKFTAIYPSMVACATVKGTTFGVGNIQIVQVVGKSSVCHIIYLLRADNGVHHCNLLNQAALFHSHIVLRECHRRQNTNDENDD